jgi:hypothetical protein|tara:strand:- start:280 stop:456 length:177 start_codon:yes stop_codon:yes gene_type:complete
LTSVLFIFADFSEIIDPNQLLLNGEVRHPEQLFISEEAFIGGDEILSSVFWVFEAYID